MLTTEREQSIEKNTLYARHNKYENREMIEFHSLSLNIYA